MADFLAEMVADRNKTDPTFGPLYEQAKERRRKLRELAAMRSARGLSQAQLARRMGTSQSLVARIESGAVDTKLSTLERYAVAVGARFSWSISRGGA
jgi:ribosome-binding protein aMBF1 (putative translation factor)